jgi:predicted RNA-binding protein associated with RNAse of E/G family
MKPLNATERVILVGLLDQAIEAGPLDRTRAEKAYQRMVRAIRGKLRGSLKRA